MCNVFIYSKSMCKIYKLKVLPRSSRMHNQTFLGIIYAFVLIGCTQICDCFDLRATLQFGWLEKLRTFYTHNNNVGW